MTHTVWCRFGRGQWQLCYSREEAEVYYAPEREILLEIPCHKNPPNNIGLQALLLSYVEKDQLPLILATFIALPWGEGGLRKVVVDTITKTLEQV